MIASLSGKVLFTSNEGVVVEVGGIGLRVAVPSGLRDKLHPGEPVFFHTYLVIRQDLLALYGFDTVESREYFELLLSVDGIGPKLALAILSIMTPDSIRRAVFNEQVELFTRVPGVGKKTAQKILLYLQDKVGKSDGLSAMTGISDSETEVIEALTSLGYSVVEAQSAVQAISRDAPKDTETRLRLALQYFSK